MESPFCPVKVAQRHPGPARGAGAKAQEMGRFPIRATCAPPPPCGEGWGGGDVGSKRPPTPTLPTPTLPTTEREKVGRLHLTAFDRTCRTLWSV